MIGDLFDYVFYRTYIFYLKRRDNTPIVFGSIVVSMIQAFCIIDLAFIFQLFVAFEMPSKFYAGVLIVLVMVINWYKYERNPDLEKMKKRWGNEPDEEKSQRGTLIVVVLGALISTPIVIGVLRHNLGLIS